MLNVEWHGSSLIQLGFKLTENSLVKSQRQTVGIRGITILCFERVCIFQHLKTCLTNNVNNCFVVALLRFVLKIK